MDAYPWRRVEGFVEPLSDEWFECRRGRITASERMHVAVHGTKRAKNKMLGELEAELHPGWVHVGSDSRYTAWGRQHEAEAIRNVEFMFDVSAYQPGLLVHEAVPIIAVTPDFRVTKFTGQLAVTGELKCPYYLRNHMKWVTDGVQANPVYATQVQTQLLVTGDPLAWFCSYHPDLPPGDQLHREVVEPDLALHELMLEKAQEIADMLLSGRRYGTGRTVAATGIPQIF